MGEYTPIPIKPTKTNIIEIRKTLYSLYIAHKYIFNEESIHPILYYDFNDLKFEFLQRIAPYFIFTDRKIHTYGFLYPDIINTEIEELTEKRANNIFYDFYIRLKTMRTIFNLDDKSQWERVVNLLKEIRQKYHIKKKIL